MREKYLYRVMPSARADMLAISEYIAQELHAPQSARKLMIDIRAAIEKACLYPEAAQLARDPMLKVRGYRMLIVRNYLVFYLVDEEEGILNIQRVVYYSRDYKRLL